jgi:hypothetical protein
MTELVDSPPTGQPPTAAPASSLSPARRWTVRLFLVLGTILAVVAIFAVWVNRQVLNADNWANTSSQVLANDAVQTQLSTYLVDQVYDNVNVAAELAAVLPPRFKPLAGPAANSLRSPAESATKKLLGRPRVQDAWQVANRLTAQQLIAIVNDQSRFVSTNGNAVILNLRAVVLDLVQRLGLPGVLIGKVPASAGKIKVLDASEVSTIRSGASAIKGLSILLPALALSLLAGAVALSRGRRRGLLLWVGIDLIFAGIAVLVARNLLGTNIVGSLVSTESVKPAASAVWTIATGILVDVAQACIVLGIPVILAALVAGPNTVATAIRRTLAPAFRDHAGPVYGVAAVISGLIVLWEPIPATRKPVLVLLMLVLFVVGIEALRRQTAREFPAASAAAQRAALVERARRAGTSVAGRGRFTRRNGEPGTTASAATTDPLDRLDRIASLHDRGVLDDAEYEAQKAAVLASTR